jgi:hypothetical protein
MRGEKVTYLSKPVTVEAAAPAAAPPVIAGTTKTFEFATPLTTIEEFDPFAEEFRKVNGILGVSGNERSITIRWDPARFTEAQLRELLASLRHAVK